MDSDLFLADAGVWNLCYEPAEIVAAWQEKEEKGWQEGNWHYCWQLAWS